MISNFFSLRSETVRAAIMRSTVISFVARCIGYLKNVTILYFLGFSSGTDIFFLAISVIALFLVVADVFDTIGVPNLVKARNDKIEFDNLASSLFTFTLFLGVILLFLIPIGLLFLKAIIGNNSTIQLSSLTLYVVLLIPYFFSHLLFHHFGSILRAQRKFTIFSLTEFIGTFSTFIIILVLLYFFKNSIVLPISLSIGQCIATGIIIIYCKDHIRLSWHLNKTFRSILKQFSQMTLIYTLSAIGTLAGFFFGMLLPIKSITALSYGSMISSIPRSIINIDRISITPFSEQVMNFKNIRRYILYSFTLFSCVAVFIYMFANSIVALLFGHGMVTGLDIHLTSSILKNFVIGLPFSAVISLYYRIFLIHNKLKICALLSIVSIVLFFLLSTHLLNNHYGVAGLALAASMTQIFVAVASFIVMSLYVKSLHLHS